MRLTQRVRTCPACMRREPPDARWCGDCGAPLTPRHHPDVVRVYDPEVVRVDDPEVVQPVVGSPIRRWVWAAVLLLVAGAVAVAVEPGVTGDSTLLGRLDDATGRSSLLPPADDLQLLWRRTVDGATAGASGPPDLVHLSDAVMVGPEVVTGDGAGIRFGDRAALSPQGTALLLDDTQVLEVGATTDTQVLEVGATTGEVLGRAELEDAGWRPTGAALGWVAGAAVFADAEGLLGAVTADGRVRWLGDPRWSWDGAGHGTDWLVVTQHGVAITRTLVIDGRTGAVHRDVGPVGTIHAPVVLGDVLVYVDPFGGVDRGLGSPVEVHGLALDGSGRSWATTDLPGTSGVTTAVRLTPVEGAVVVHYWSVGHATTAVWLAPDGSQVGQAVAGGTGTTDEGWPVTAVLDDAVVHVDPAGDDIRALTNRGVVRWSIPATAGEGVLAAGDVVLVRTPPRGLSLQSRLRLLDAGSGEVVWQRIADSTHHQRFAGTLGGHVGVGAGGWPAPLAQQSWFALDTGRRRSGTALASQALGASAEVAPGLQLLGSVPVGARIRPVFLVPGDGGPGQLVSSDPDAVTPSVTSLLAGGRPGARVVGTIADEALDVVVGAASVTARDPVTGNQRWRSENPTALRSDLALLLEEVVVTVGVDGSLQAWERSDGRLRWTGPTVAVTALTAGGDEVVVGTAGGELLVLTAAGQVQQRLVVGSEPVEDVAVIDGRVLVTVGGDLVAYGRGAAFVEPGDRVELP